jgi:chromosome segregation ATPase
MIQMDEPKEMKQAKSLLKKASEELAAKNEEVSKLKEELAGKDKLISELTARQEKLAKENEAVSKELKEIKQEARDVVLKEQIEAEEKLGILEVSKEQRLAELRELDEAGGFDLYAKQTKKMLELHKSVGERKTLINNSNQAADRKQEIAQALGISL